VRDAPADRISQSCLAADEFLASGIVFEQTLGHGADEKFEKPSIDAFGLGL
jgi:hypothetical protein